eukprot:INCI5875.16.p1 GENE.INCI5875.16~~INCI5875.16.p1  ORF type:complete len:713 (-),score=89.44 INCI5875.16:334-2472(-)
MQRNSSVAMAYAFALLVALSIHQLALAAVVFNVGLPRTGTTSFHYAMASMNHSSQHVAFNVSRYDLEKLNLKQNLQRFRNSCQGPFRYLFDSFDAFSDTPVYGLIPALRKCYPDAAIVATHRSRGSWLKSMARNPGAGADFLWQDSQLHEPYNRGGCKDSMTRRKRRSAACSGAPSQQQQREALFDRHADLMDEYGVIRIDLEDNSTVKWQKLLSVLPDTNPVVQAANACLHKLKWPSQNQGHMTNVGISRLVPNMAQATLDHMRSNCDFDFKTATKDTEVVRPTMPKAATPAAHAHAATVASAGVQYRFFDTKKNQFLNATNPISVDSNIIAACAQPSTSGSSCNVHWWHFPRSDCGYTDVKPQPACARGNVRGKVDVLKSCCLLTDGCSGFNTNGILKKAQCIHKILPNQPADLYVLQDSPQPKAGTLGADYPAIDFSGVGTGTSDIVKFAYTSCTGAKASIGRCGIATGESYLFEGENCQDPDASKALPTRCWQSTLEKAAAICARHNDCFGVTRDNVGFEPRRSTGPLRQAASAHELWVVDRSTLSSGASSDASHASARQAGLSSPVAAASAGAPVVNSENSHEYNDFRETMRQRVAFKDYPHLTLKSYHTCDGSRDRDNSCNVIRGSAHTVAEVAASGPASGDTVALRERVAEINAIPNYDEDLILLAELRSIRARIRMADHVRFFVRLLFHFAPFAFKFLGLCSSI